MNPLWGRESAAFECIVSGHDYSEVTAHHPAGSRSEQVGEHPRSNRRVELDRTIVELVEDDVA